MKKFLVVRIVCISMFIRTLQCDTRKLCADVNGVAGTLPSQITSNSVIGEMAQILIATEILFEVKSDNMQDTTGL